MTPRPTKDNNATAQVCFRCTPKDHAGLKRLAAIAGQSMSAYILASTLGETEAPEVVLPPTAAAVCDHQVPVGEECVPCALGGS